MIDVNEKNYDYFHVFILTGDVGEGEGEFNKNNSHDSNFVSIKRGN